MIPSFYDTSVGSYLQTVRALQSVLNRAEQYAIDGALSLEDSVSFQFHEDMLPFSFQVISVWHHSKGALEGMKNGLFQPPPKVPDVDWAKLVGLLAEARVYLEDQERDAVEAISGGDMRFKAGSLDIPYTTDQFLLSFSLPNFYFHATTTYTMLRHLGVPIGKLDFLGMGRQ